MQVSLIREHLNSGEVHTKKQLQRQGAWVFSAISEKKKKEKYKIVHYWVFNVQDGQEKVQVNMSTVYNLYIIW